MMDNTKCQLMDKPSVSFSRWQFVSQGHWPAAHLFYIQLALEAGCRWIQLRLKELPDTAVVELGQVAAALCKTYNGIFILNDYVHLVKLVEADGVHLGHADCQIERARSLLGPHYIIGGTANTAGDITRRIKEKVDYIGLGPYRFTTTKKKISPVLGPEGYNSLLQQEIRRGHEPGAAGDLMATPPIYAIGGIQMEDLLPLFETRVYGVAISGWLTRIVDLAGIEKLMEVQLCCSNALAFYQQWKANFPGQAAAILSSVRRFHAAMEEAVSKKQFVQQY